MSEMINFFEIIIGSSKFMDSQFFVNLFCVYGFDQFIVPIKLKHDRKYRHLGSGNLVSKFELQAAIYTTNSVTVFLLLLYYMYTVQSCIITHAWLVQCTLPFDMTGHFHDVRPRCFVNECDPCVLFV